LQLFRKEVFHSFPLFLQVIAKFFYYSNKLSDQLIRRRRVAKYNKLGAYSPSSTKLQQSPVETDNKSDLLNLF
jgi:hypothetical protein